MLATTDIDVENIDRRDVVLGVLRDDILEIAKGHRVRTISLTGSVARGEDTENSDYDFLVDFTETVGLFTIARLQTQLEDLLGCSVDVIPRTCVRESCRSIFNDEIPL